MSARLLSRTSFGPLLIAAVLISLTGCQLLGKQQSQINDSVVLGSPNMDFGKVGLGSSKTMQNKLTNFKTTSVTIASIAGPDANVQIIGISLPLVLTPGQEAQFSVQFQPSAMGNVSKTVSFSDDSQFLASMVVAGEGVEGGQLVLNPSSVNFENLKIGANSTNNVTLSNSGATDVTISQASLSGAGFTMSNLALPLTLHPGNTASFSVTFAPTGAGNFTGSVSFSTVTGQARRSTNRKAQAGQGGTTVLALSGVGIQAGTLSANPTSVTRRAALIGNPR